MSNPADYQRIYKNLFGKATASPKRIEYPTFNNSEPNFRIPGTITAKLDEYEKSLKLSKIVDDADKIDRNSPDSVHPYVQVAVSIFLFEVCMDFLYFFISLLEFF